MTPTKIALARRMYETHQHSLAEIARTLGVSRASIYRHLGRQSAGTEPRRTIRPRTR